MKSVCIIILSILTYCLHAELTADWSDRAYIPDGENRANVFNLDEHTLEVYKIKGYTHAQNYPVSVTGLLIPYRPLLTFLESNPTNELKKILYSLGKDFTGFYSEKDMYAWLGLFENNSAQESGIYKIPYANGVKDQFYIGAGIIKNKTTEGLTFSCFACHSNYLFGKVVMGLTNKHPRANKFFHMARGTIPHLPTPLFALSTNSTKLEAEMFARTKANLLSVDTNEPSVLGLDTSLSQVALSLARRNSDEYATKSQYFEKHPRFNELSKKIADSKPMPWWNVKYKTRWLSDGSIVQGNPIYTNLLWNEIGRGTDLIELESWLKNNQKTVNELTTAVFATEAPLWTDFFPANTIKIRRAKHGEKIFKNTCSNCHGTYEKGWSRSDADSLSAVELLKTQRVIYHDRTPVEDVGTDPARYEGMKYFAEELNNLAISKMMKTLVIPQKGYVPSPLVGIWSRYPYLHNNSIPNLCALMTPPHLRPIIFVQGPSANAQTDFDFDCVGYPTGEKIPMDWWNNKEAIFDVRKPGLSNIGHYKMFLDENGKELLTEEDKKDLREFLKTL